MVSTCMGSRNRLRSAVLETEFSNLEQGLDAGLLRVRIGHPVDLKTLALDVDAVGDPDVKLGEFNPALETRRKSFDDPSTQNRLGPRDHDPCRNSDNPEEDNKDPDNPTPSAVAPWPQRRDRIAGDCVR